MRRSLLIALTLLAVLAPSAAARSLDLRWEPRPTGSTQGFRGLDALDARSAWVTGSRGQVLRTSDGGRTWQDVSPPAAAGLDLRDVEVTGKRRASVLAVGSGEASRIFTTLDGGATWRTAFVNDSPEAFYDCLAFYAGGRRGLALSDPVGGRFRIAATDDGGVTWRVLPSTGMPEAVTGEFAFAASGTCIATAGHDAWFATGGPAARVFRSRDGGLRWSVKTAPIPPSDAGGVFSLAFRNPRDGVMVGGDFTAPENGVDASGFTHDGRRWWPGGDLGGYRSGVDWLGFAAIAVGPTGSDVSLDGGRRWRAFDTGSFDAVDCERLACWASGQRGAVAVLRAR